MAHYDYACRACEYTWELNVPIANRNDAVAVPCPACQKPEIERVFAPAGINYMMGDSVKKRTPEAFKDVLRNIKKHHRHSTINV